MKNNETEKNQNDNGSARAFPVPEAYSNTAMVSFSPYEFEITLGLGSSNYEGVKPVVNIRMSPQFAREFAKILAENVSLFQQQAGK